MTDIKVKTIVNIIRVHNDYVRRIYDLEQKCNYYKRKGDKANFYKAEAELNKTKTEHGEFLDFYI